MIYLFGIIGVPIHEFSHYLFCKLFGHKVIEAKFFKPDMETRTMGYVSHSYDNNNFFQSSGLFFIGLAPMIVGTILISILIKAFFNEGFKFSQIFSNPSLILKYIAFIYIFMAIVSNMTLSKADLMGSFKGLTTMSIFIIICIVCIYQTNIELLIKIGDGLFNIVWLVFRLSLINLGLCFGISLFSR